MAVLRFPFLSPDLSMRDPHRLASSRALSTHAKPRFCEQDRLLCEYGCWAFAVFTGEGDSHPRDGLFQRAFVEAGGLDSIGSAMEAHRDSASLRRFVAAAFVARIYVRSTSDERKCFVHQAGSKEPASELVGLRSHAFAGGEQCDGPWPCCCSGTPPTPQPLCRWCLRNSNGNPREAS